MSLPPLPPQISSESTSYFYPATQSVQPAQQTVQAIQPIEPYQDIQVPGLTGRGLRTVRVTQSMLERLFFNSAMYGVDYMVTWAV